MSSKVKKKPEKFRYTKGTFSVVKFYEHEIKTKSFDCIPDLWFVNEEKCLCYWPPKSKKSATWRAMNQDEPEDDWSVYECELISEGHVTYSAGSDAAREKASQNYNTSSADEHIQEAKFRREHPGLIHKGEKFFENVFATAKAAQVNEKIQSEVSHRKTQGKSNDMRDKESDAGYKTARNIHSQPRSIHSQPRSIHSHPRSNNSHSRNNQSASRSRSRSNNSVTRSQPRSIHSHPRSNNSHSRNNQSASRSLSRSNNSVTRSQPRSIHSHPRSNNSHSRSNNSHSRNNQSASRSRSRSNNSVTRSQPRSIHSHPRSNNSHSRSTNSHSRSNNSHSRNNQSASRSRSRSNNSVTRSQPRSIHSHPRSNNSHSRNNQSASRSLSRSNNSVTRSQPRSIHSHPRSIHSHTRSNNSHSRSNNSHSRSNQSASRSRSRSNNSVTRSHSRSRRTRSRSSHSQSNRNCSRSKSYESKSNYSQPRINHSQRHSRSQSGSKKSQLLSSGNRHYSKAYTSSVQITNRDNLARRQLSLRTSDSMDGLRRSSSNIRERQNFNEKSKEKRLDTHHQRELHSAKNHPRQSEKNSRKNNFSASSRRIEEMDRLHQKRVANRSKVLRNVSSPDLSSRRSDSQHRHREYDSPGLLDMHSSNDSTLLQTLMKELGEIKKIVTKNDRRFVESDRRLTRLETTANKTFIVLGDVSNAINARMLLGNTLAREDRPPKGFHTPEMPITRFKQLVMVNKDLKNKSFFNYLLNCEKEYCCHSSSTDTATMTAYLRRFIDVDLRASIVLKDLKGQEGMTLYHDFHNVYLFLIETMKEGYRIKNKIMSNKDVHLVLRTVWGRSKQAADEANKKR